MDLKPNLTEYFSKLGLELGAEPGLATQNNCHSAQVTMQSNLDPVRHDSLLRTILLVRNHVTTFPWPWSRFPWQWSWFPCRWGLMPSTRSVILSPWWVFPRPSPIDVTIPTDSREECSQNVAKRNDTVTVQKVFHRNLQNPITFQP
jgi:hypothetical protein